MWYLLHDSNLYFDFKSQIQHSAKIQLKSKDEWVWDCQQAAILMRLICFSEADHSEI